MKTQTRLGLLIGLCFGLAVPYLMGARNGSGTYSLPNTGTIPNPVITGTTITSAWANGTLTDISSELTDSLSRSGKGGMSAPLVCTAGTAAAPSLTFAGTTNTGFFSLQDGGVALSLAGTQSCTAESGDGFKCVFRLYGNGLSGSNTQGVYGIGDGTGAGVEGAGGASDGIGVKGTGGETNGAGGQFTGSGSGGYGVIGQGTAASYAGGRFLNSQTTTAAVRYNAIEVTQDDIVFTSTVEPAGDAGIDNRLTAIQFPKAMAIVTSGAATPTLQRSLNIESATCSGSNVTMQLVSDLSSSGGFEGYCLATPHGTFGAGATAICWCSTSDSGGQTTLAVGCDDASTSNAIDLCSTQVASGINVILFGPQ